MTPYFDVLDAIIGLGMAAGFGIFFGFIIGINRFWFLTTWEKQPLS